MPSRTRKKPSGVRSPVQNSASASSTSLVRSVRGERVGARDDERRHVGDVGGEPRRDERAHELARRHEHLAAEMAALLLRRELVLEVDGRRAGLDEGLHELERVQRPAEARLRVGDDRRQPVDGVVALGVRDLVGAQERVVDAASRARARCSPGRGSGRDTCCPERFASAATCQPGEVDRLRAPPSPSARPGRRSARRAREPTRPPRAGARSRSAPRRASVCSTLTEPRRRSTSASAVGALDRVVGLMGMLLWIQ